MGNVIAKLMERPVVCCLLALYIIAELVVWYVRHFPPTITERIHSRESRARVLREFLHSKPPSIVKVKSYFIPNDSLGRFYARHQKYPDEEGRPLRNNDTVKPTTSSSSSVISPDCTRMSSHGNLQAQPMIQYQKENEKEAGNEVVVVYKQEAYNEIAKANEGVENEMAEKMKEAGNEGVENEIAEKMKEAGNEVVVVYRREAYNDIAKANEGVENEMAEKMKEAGNEGVENEIADKMKEAGNEVVVVYRQEAYNEIAKANEGVENEIAEKMKEAGNEVVVVYRQEAYNNIAKANEGVENEIAEKIDGEVVIDTEEEVEKIPIAMGVEVIQVKQEMRFEAIEVAPDIPPEQRERRRGTMIVTMKQVTKRSLSRERKKTRKTQ